MFWPVTYPPPSDAKKATEDLKPHQAELVISATPSFAPKWLVPRLGSFAESQPHSDVTVDAATKLANFQDDGIDIAVRQGKFEGPAN